MKGKYLIAIAFLASWTVITASKLPDIFADQCPAVDTCPPVLLSHTECNKYYECRNGQPLETVCAAGLYFSKDWHGCVDWQISDCGKGSTGNECTQEGQLVPHECKCKKYYLCKGGRKALRECYPGMHFDKTVRMCVLDPMPPECKD